MINFRKHENHIRGHHQLIEEITKAIEQEEFVMYYQPKVNMRSGDIIGVEALVRWRHPEKGFLTPSAFLAPIQENSIAADFGEKIFHWVFKDMFIWQKKGLNFNVSINVFPAQLMDIKFASDLQNIMMQYKNYQEPKYF